MNSNTTASQSNCSSTHPLHSISENGEESDMEEQVPELVDISDNEISSTKDNTRDNGQGPTKMKEMKMKRIKMRIPDIPTDQ